MDELSSRSGNSLVRDAAGARRLNRWQRPWFRTLPPKGYGVLTTTGRASGRPHELCIRAIRHGDIAYVTAIKGGRPDWVRNIQANPRVTLRMRGGTFAARGRLLDTATAEHATATSVYVHIVSFDYATCVMHLGGIPTAAKIRRLLAGWFDMGTPVALDLTVGR